MGDARLFWLRAWGNIRSRLLWLVAWGSARLRWLRTWGRTRSRLLRLVARGSARLRWLRTWGSTRSRLLLLCATWGISCPVMRESRKESKLLVDVVYLEFHCGKLENTIAVPRWSRNGWPGCCFCWWRYCWTWWGVI